MLIVDGMVVIVAKKLVLFLQFMLGNIPAELMDIIVAILSIMSQSAFNFSPLMTPMVLMRPG